MNVPITLACWDYDRMRALMDGQVRPEGVELTYLPLMMPEPAFRMQKHGEFEVSEMSLSWYSRTVAANPRPFIALPVFPSRMFRHSSVYVNSESGIEKPSDLAGRRVGCPEYQMTAAVWIKGILADRYDLPVDSVHYLTGGLEQPGRIETPMTLPSNIDVRAIPTDKTLSSMLANREIDALYTAHAPSSFGDGTDRVRRLWANPAEEEQAYYEATGIFPIMHVIVIRGDVYASHPWLAQSMMKAFEAAKQIAYQALTETTALKYMLPWQVHSAEQMYELMGSDPFSYGLEGNEATLATFLRYSYEQGLTPRQFEPEELFAPETLDTFRI